MITDRRRIDCEGLRGSEPLVNQVWHQIRELQANARRRVLPHSRATDNDHLRTTYAQPPPVAAMPLLWADQEGSDPWQVTLVRQIYPRFLYVFSDVVCYVSRNAKYVLHLTPGLFRPKYLTFPGVPKRTWLS